MVLKSKKGYLASEILGYRVIDRHQKKMGSIKDLLINCSTYFIDYIKVGRKEVIPVSFINRDDSTRKEIVVSQTKDRIKQAISDISSSYSLKCNNFSDIKKSIVYDITGSELGNIENIAYHPGLKVDFLVKKGDSHRRFPNYFIIPTESVCQSLKKAIVLGVTKDELGLVNLTGFHHLFLDYQVYEKKRYVIVEAPINTVSYYLSLRDEALEKASETLFIEELDVSKDVKVNQFVKLFNVVLATSPDTFLPLSRDDARKFFQHSTFVVYEYNQPIGYCCVTIEREDKDINTGVIAGIGVHPSSRGKNVALTLVNQALRYLIDHDVDAIQADIYEMNMPSLRLFSSLGFQEVGETFLA